MSTLETFRQKEAAAHEAFKLADIYWRDGALATAATHLADAAKLLREASDARNAALGLPLAGQAPA